VAVGFLKKKKIMPLISVKRNPRLKRMFHNMRVSVKGFRYWVASFGSVAVK
jgi:hypothetical protein